MFPFSSARSKEVVKVPNHAIIYGLILWTLGALICLGSLTRLYELREFFPLQPLKEVNEYILDYIPFILGTFVTTVAALAALIVGLNWIMAAFREVSLVRIPVRRAGDYFRPQGVSLALKEGTMRSYARPPSLIFALLGKFWSGPAQIPAIPAEIIRMNLRFIWAAVIIAGAVHLFFRLLEFVPPYLDGLGLGTGYVIPSPAPFYNLLLLVCLFKTVIVLSLVPLRKSGAAREMDSMIVEGKGHPSMFFAILEEGSRIFAQKGFANRISRSSAVKCQDGETLIGTLIESFPEYVKTASRPAAYLCLLLGSVMVVVGFLQVILTQYPTFSVGYSDFFRLHLFGLVMDIFLNVFIILFGKGFLEQARALMSIYRFRSSLVYLEAKGDFESKAIPELGDIVSPERLFNPLSPSAFNVRYFSAEAVSEAVTPEGVRELVTLETSGRLAKDVARLKYLPFQVTFRERYPSCWTTVVTDQQHDDEEEIVRAADEDLGAEEVESAQDTAASVQR